MDDHSADSLARLCDLFPEHPVPFLSQVLSFHHGDLDRSISSVLEGQAQPQKARESAPKRGGGPLAIGSEVLVVEKDNQRTGVTTRGVVLELLTRGDYHPHGVKVRLTDGTVGRVKKIL